MTFIAGAIIWAGYTCAWWGWEALTDRVPVGQPDTFWWPSIRDLVVPGRAAFAYPQQVGSGGVKMRAGVTQADIEAAKTSPKAFSDLFPTPGTGQASTPG